MGPLGRRFASRKAKQPGLGHGITASSLARCDRLECAAEQGGGEAGTCSMCAAFDIEFPAAIRSAGRDRREGSTTNTTHHLHTDTLRSFQISTDLRRKPGDDDEANFSIRLSLPGQPPGGRHGMARAPMGHLSVDRAFSRVSGVSSSAPQLRQLLQCLVPIGSTRLCTRRWLSRLGLATRHHALRSRPVRFSSGAWCTTNPTQPRGNIIRRDQLKISRQKTCCCVGSGSVVNNCELDWPLCVAAAGAVPLHRFSRLGFVSSRWFARSQGVEFRHISPSRLRLIGALIRLSCAPGTTTASTDTVVYIQTGELLFVFRALYRSLIGG